MTKRLEERLRAILPDLRRIRRHIHQHPELGLSEFATADLIQRELEGCGVAAARVGATGVVGLLRGKPGGRTVALRADIDALRIRERTGLPYASTNDCMHACGHDGNTTVVLGAAKILAGLAGRFTGTIKFLFQPCEEGGEGAKQLIAGGAMVRPRVDAIFAMHGYPDLAVGSVAVKSGAITAHADSFTMTVRGKGGHGARPESAVDSVLIAAKIVDAVQTIVSRELSAMTPAVVTVGSIHGGSAENVIPDTVEMSGTIRTFAAAEREHVIASLRRIARRTAEAHGGRCSVRIIDKFRATINDERMTDAVVRAGREVLGPGKVVLLDEPATWSEDFSEYLQHAPGALLLLGLKGRSRPVVALHNPEFDFNDRAIPVGVRMFVQLALARLRARA